MLLVKGVKHLTLQWFQCVCMGVCVRAHSWPRSSGLVRHDYENCQNGVTKGLGSCPL